METLKQHFWELFAIFELLVIIWLIIKYVKQKKKRSPEEEQIRQAKENKVDMEDLMKDLHLSSELFRELSRKCHPDRFAGSDLESPANELFQLIQQNKSNYRELVALKEKAITELNIQLS
jgi:hypothetical protein